MGAMKAWLVKWVSVSDEDAFVTVLSASLDADTVRCRVEQLHTDLTGSIAEKLEYARYPNPAPLAYPANLSRLPDGSVRIDCGHNPHLEALRVTDLRVETNEDGSEVLHYFDGKRTRSATNNWLDGIHKVQRSSLSQGGVADDQ